MSFTPDSGAPAGRNKPAQGKEAAKAADAALGGDVQNTSSPEGAEEKPALPNGWEWKTVGEMVEEMQYGSSAKTSDDINGVPVLRMGNIKDGGLVLDSLKYLPADHDEFPSLLLREGDLLFNRTNSAELVGKSAVYRGNPSPCSCASYLIRARLRSDYVPEFLANYINSTFGRAWISSVVSQQVGQANVNGTKLKALFIPVPPLPEQRRIVAEIEKQFTRLEAGVAALRRVQANLKRYRAAVLKAACEGKLVKTEAELATENTENTKKGTQSASASSEASVAKSSGYETGAELLARILAERRKNWTGRGKYKEPAAPDTANLPPLPKGWSWACLDQIASVALGKMLDKAKHQTGKKLRYLRNSNVRWGWVDTDDCLEMFFEDEEIERFGVRAGDVLVCEGGEPGRAAVWDGREAGMMYQKAIHRVRFFGQFQARFLVFLLEFLAKTGRLERWFTGSTIKHFTRESFITLPIPLPPLAEQTRIVAEVERRLSVVEELESVVWANLQRATRLRQSILRNAFTGELIN